MPYDSWQNIYQKSQLQTHQLNDITNDKTTGVTDLEFRMTQNLTGHPNSNKATQNTLIQICLTP